MDTKSLISIWNHTQRHAGTSGARACAGVLLGLYNGERFRMDLTDLRVLEGVLLTAALAVIAHDATYCKMEVHAWLNTLSGRDDFSERFEALAFEYKTFKRGCVGKRGDYAHITRLVIAEPQVEQHCEGVGSDVADVVAARARWDAAFDAEVNRAGLSPIVSSAVVPKGEVWIQQSGRGLAKIVNVGDGKMPLTTDEIDAHHRAMITPFFNDLAG